MLPLHQTRWYSLDKVHYSRFMDESQVLSFYLTYRLKMTSATSAILCSLSETSSVMNSPIAQLSGFICWERHDPISGRPQGTQSGGLCGPYDRRNNPSRPYIVGAGLAPPWGGAGRPPLQPLRWGGRGSLKAH